MRTLLLAVSFLVLALPALAAPVSCATTTTFGDLTGAVDGCQDQDKIYSNWFGDLPSGTEVLIETVSGLVDTHIVSIGALDIGTYTFGYMISIDPLTPDYDFRNITQVTLGFDSAGQPGNAAYKEIYLNGVLFDTLFSSGGVDASALFSEKSVQIVEIISVTNSTYQSTTNSFTQEVTAIPEPGTYAMIGFGLLGLVLSTKRRSASKS